MDQRVGAGAYDDAGIGECPEVFGRHLLVVEGHHVATFGEPLQRLEVGLVADLGAGHDLGGAVRAVAGQHPQRDAELDRRTGHHAGELTTADDADNRESHAADFSRG